MPAALADVPFTVISVFVGFCCAVIVKTAASAANSTLDAVFAATSPVSSIPPSEISGTVASASFFPFYKYCKVVRITRRCLKPRCQNGNRCICIKGFSIYIFECICLFNS